jgi:hypothetical protein
LTFLAIQQDEQVSGEGCGNLPTEGRGLEMLGL